MSHGESTGRRHHHAAVAPRPEGPRVAHLAAPGSVQNRVRHLGYLILAVRLLTADGADPSMGALVSAVRRYLASSDGTVALPEVLGFRVTRCGDSPSRGRRRGTACTVASTRAEASGSAPTGGRRSFVCVLVPPPGDPILRWPEPSSSSSRYSSRPCPCVGLLRTHGDVWRKNSTTPHPPTWPPSPCTSP